MLIGYGDEYSKLRLENLLSFLYRHQVLLTFSLVSLAILGPLLKPGYILTLDSPIAFNREPIAHLAGLTSIPTSVFGATGNSAPYSLVMSVLDRLMPSWLVQKILLFLILLLAGVGVTRLPLLQGVGRYFAGVFYVLNPFIYIRFMAGQWGLLLGYALMPFALKAFIDLLENATLRNAIKLALLVTLVGLAQLHSLALLLLLFLVLLIVKLVREGTAVPYRRLVRSSSVALGLFIAVNLFWIIPFLTDIAAGQTVVGRFDDRDRELFQPVSISSLGVVFDVASLHGFWRGTYNYAGDFFALWWLPFVLILFLVFLGAVTWVNRVKEHWLPLGLAVIGFLSFVLALGVATSPTGFVFKGLWAAAPGFAIFRDSHKFLALLALAYAYLGALGVQELWRLYAAPRIHIRWHWSRLLIMGSLLLPLAIAFPMVGSAGQMRATDFPEEWQDVRDVLKADRADYQVLFLPWHMYMGFDWLPNDEKLLADPSPGFFGTEVIGADNIEFGVFSQSVNPVSEYIALLLAHSQEIDNFGELLAPLNVRYVILVEEADFEEYDFLRRQQDLVIALERPGITLFQSTYPHGRAYAVSNVRPLSNLKDIIEISRTEDILGSVYVLKEGPDLEGSAQQVDNVPEFPKVRRNHVASFRIGETSKPFTVFVTKYGSTSQHWRLEGQGPEVMNLGMMPVYRSDGSAATVSFGRWPWYLALNTFSLLMTLASVGYLLRPRIWGLIHKRWS